MANKSMTLDSVLAREIEELAAEKGMTLVGALNYIVRVGFTAFRNQNSTGKTAVRTAEGQVESRDMRGRKASPREFLG